MKIPLILSALTLTAFFACAEPPNAPTISTIEVSSAKTALMSDDSTSLAVVIQGINSPNLSAAWKASEGKLSQTNGVTTQFTAPSVTKDTQITITATSLQNTSKSATVTLTIAPRLPNSSITDVAISSDATRLAAAATTNISAKVRGTGKFSNLVNWSVVSGSGTLAASAGNATTFTAPTLSSSSTTVIKATSVQDPSKSATVTVENAASAAPPANSNYQSNLQKIRAARVRNTNLDSSSFRNTPMTDIPIAALLGPRTDYITGDDGSVPGNPGGNPEPGFPTKGVGTFRTACEFSHFAYDDPLVHPNKPGAAHLHMFWGNTDVNAYSTYDTLKDSGSSTCNGMELNRTGYWAPAMFDAQGNVRVPERVIIYYKGYGLANGKSQVYPPGAAMVIDDKVHRIGDGAGGVAETNFLCADQFRGARNSPSMTIPVCGDYVGWRRTLEMHVKFANCWNRQDPSKPENWVLPRQGSWFYSDCQENATTPNIEYIIAYPLEQGETTAGWYLASDIDPETRTLSKAGGSTVHADWWGGWNPTVNQQWIDNCVNFKKDSNGDGVDDVDHGCGFGYLTDGGPEVDANGKQVPPLPGPALKYRQQYTGPIKVPAATLYQDLCDPNKPLTTTTQAAYCTPPTGVKASHNHHSAPSK